MLTGVKFVVSFKVKLKVKLSLSFLTEHHAITIYFGSGGLAPHILDVATRWR